MKKTVILTSLFLFLFIFTTPLSAQWFSFGMKGGYSTILKQKQSYKETFNISGNLQNGFHLGLYMRMGRTWYIQPEALFNYYNCSSTINYENKNIFENKKYQINTLDIPVLLGVNLANTRMFKMRVMVGPKFSFNIGSTTDVLDDFNSFTQTLRNTRLGLDCGIGFDIWRITLDVRYNLVQDLYKYQNLEGTTFNNKPLYSIQASIGYRIAGDNKKKTKYGR